MFRNVASTTMSDGVDAIYLAEFDRLRTESDGRAGIAGQIIIAQIVGLGAGVGFLDKVPDILLGLAAASVLLWLYWCDHTLNIHRIGRYISLVLAPALRDRHPEAPALLAWEAHIRGDTPPDWPGGAQVSVAAVLLWLTSPVLIALHSAMLTAPSVMRWYLYTFRHRPFVNLMG